MTAKIASEIIFFILIIVDNCHCCCVVLFYNTAKVNKIIETHNREPVKIILSERINKSKR